MHSKDVIRVIGNFSISARMTLNITHMTGKREKRIKWVDGLELSLCVPSCYLDGCAKTQATRTNSFRENHLAFNVERSSKYSTRDSLVCLVLRFISISMNGRCATLLELE